MDLRIHNKYNSKQGVKFDNPLKDVLDPVFLLLILGRPGSGKSTILKNMLNNQKYLSKKYNRIIYVTPTQIHDQKLLFNEMNWNKDFDKQWIQTKIIDAQNDSIKNLLFVFDDTIAKWSLKQNRSFIKDFIWNRRHLLKNGSISIIITSQRYNALPTDVRSSLTNMIIFNQSTKQADLIFNDSNSNKLKQQFKSKIVSLQKGDYVFLNCINGNMYNKKLKTC